MSSFNTPLESGLRALYVLSALAPRALDLDCVAILDYLLVHSGDIDQGPESMHPPLPHRSGELLVRRDLVDSGLRFVAMRGLVAVVYGPSGISYAAKPEAQAFLEYLSSHYARGLKERAQWLANRFRDVTTQDLEAMVLRNIAVWGATDNEMLVDGDAE